MSSTQLASALLTHTLHDPIRTRVAQQIEAAIALLQSESAVAGEPASSLFTALAIHDALGEPPNPELGDLAFGCFQLAKQLRAPPPQIAQKLKDILLRDELSANLSDSLSASGIEAVVATGPYLNLTISMAAWGEKVLSQAASGELFKYALTQNTQRTMVEYCQPNTHKELHVGHMRNLCLGFSMVNLLKYAGFDIVTATFPGDVGTHVAKCLWYMKFHNTEPVPKHGKGEWLGKMYSKGHLKLDDELKTEQEAKNREQLTLILKQLQAHEGEFFDLWKETREWSIELMKTVYRWAGVTFDRWYWESDVDTASVELARQLFAEGKLIKSEGAVGMDLSADNLGFMMMLKSDGTGLYATKDVELARRKFQDEKIEKSLYVVDMRQSLHFKQVFKCLEKLGFEQAKNCFHLPYNFVELPDGPMSSRKGNIIPLTDLIERMQETVKTQYLSRYDNEWTGEEQNEVAEQVAQGAIKYGMVRMDTNKKIVFDMAEWLKLDGESGPFIQYSHARIMSLLKKQNYDGSIPVAWTQLSHKAERRVAQMIGKFNSVTVEAAENYRPSLVTAYLYELAKSFNAFYHDCPVATAETTEMRVARLALVSAVGKVLEKGLELLGIPAPQRM